MEHTSRTEHTHNAYQRNQVDQCRAILNVGYVAEMYYFWRSLEDNQACSCSLYLFPVLDKSYFVLFCVPVVSHLLWVLLEACMFLHGVYFSFSCLFLGFLCQFLPLFPAYAQVKRAGVSLCLSIYLYLYLYLYIYIYISLCVFRPLQTMEHTAATVSCEQFCSFVSRSCEPPKKLWGILPSDTFLSTFRLHPGLWTCLPEKAPHCEQVCSL